MEDSKNIQSPDVEQLKNSSRRRRTYTHKMNAKNKRFESIGSTEVLYAAFTWRVTEEQDIVLG